MKASLILISFFYLFAANAGEYFVIQNVASERTRVYEKCSEYAGCPHRMVAEMPMLVGMPEETGDGSRYRYRTWVGNLQITAWKKFYQDYAGHYPSWYSPLLPPPPPPKSSLFEWMKKKYLADSSQDARGAFGWYTAHLGPNAGAQWMHGTFGWAKDGDFFLSRVHSDSRGAYLNFSSGCTRLENSAIALLQHILPVGTKVFRIYAKEAVRDSALTDYRDQQSPVYWDFLLTKEDVNTDARYSSDKEKVLSLGLSGSAILDEGTYAIDQYPDAVKLKRISEGRTRSSGSRIRRGTTFYQGDIYQIGKEKFRGVFYVDQGLLEGYSHPNTSRVYVGGSGKAIPGYLKL